MNDILGDFKRKVADNKFTDEEWDVVLMHLYADIKTETTMAVANRNLGWKKKHQNEEREEFIKEYNSLMESFNDLAVLNFKRLRGLYYKYKYTKK